jgi:CRP-like cAMP-binding protein
MVRRITSPSNPPVNRLLTRLPKPDLKRLGTFLERVTLDLRQVIHERNSPMEFVYFPISGVVSAITVSLDGESIEVATIGNEGMVGLAAFVGAEQAAARMLIQVRGEALRMSVKDFRTETAEDNALRRLLIRYFGAFFHQVSQAVLCNGLHSVKKRCCKWLLMTHEFMSEMLGVRRAGVSELLSALHADKVIENSSKRIVVLDRPKLEGLACECYRSFRDEFENW